jgi:uncharacterized protein YlxW (UPF0749 family)
MTAAVILFGLSITEAAALIVGAAYVTSLIRDWRPMKAMRNENRELRADLNAANEKIHDLEVKVHELERTSVPVLQEEIAKVARILDRLDQSVKANTAAVELIAKQAAIAGALSDK